MNADILLFKITLLFYAVATVLYLVDVIGRQGKAGTIARWLLLSGFGVHCATLVVRFLQTDYTPVANLHESVSFFAWCIVGIFLLFDLRY
ncbi:MAG TPA: c-type cytochrome biogenesis protein CcsB, partial [Desulfuromonadales bacterium]|nr:c-type cytochrome biogenesis protein CcsB [Desulfuromonadales bacterium]